MKRCKKAKAQSKAFFVQDKKYNMSMDCIRLWTQDRLFAIYSNFITLFFGVFLGFIYDGLEYSHKQFGGKGAMVTLRNLFKLCFEFLGKPYADVFRLARVFHVGILRQFVFCSKIYLPISCGVV